MRKRTRRKKDALVTCAQATTDFPSRSLSWFSHTLTLAPESAIPPLIEDTDTKHEGSTASMRCLHQSGLENNDEEFDSELASATGCDYRPLVERMVFLKFLLPVDSARRDLPRRELNLRLERPGSLRLFPSTQVLQRDISTGDQTQSVSLQ